MMRFILTTTLMVLMAGFAFAQSAERTRELQLFGTAGFKVLEPKNFDYAMNICPSAVPTIGGGALWQLRKFNAGFEFSYADGKKNTQDFGTIFTGITFNILGSYQWAMGRRSRWSVQSGFGYSLHHLSVTDHHYSGTANLNTAIYHNLVFSVPLAVMFQLTNRKGTFTGVRLGYNFNVMPNEWRYIEGSTTQRYVAGSDGLFFQVVLGGILPGFDKKS